MPRSWLRLRMSWRRLRAGTKALLLEPGGKFIREVNRSYYHAEAYRYPLALFTLPDGRTGLVHCLEEYNPS